LCFMLGVALGSYVMFSKVTVTTPGPDGQTTSFLGGAGEQAANPLSLRLRTALGDLQICNASREESAQETCRTAYQKLFKIIPTEKDLAQIEKVEGDLKKGSATAPDEYFKLRTAFEK